MNVSHNRMQNYGIIDDRSMAYFERMAVSPDRGPGLAMQHCR